MLDCRSKAFRFDPRPGHENFLKSVTNNITHIKEYMDLHESFTFKKSD